MTYLLKLLYLIELCSSDGEASGEVDNFANDQARPLNLVLQVPESLPSVLQHHIDFIVCGDYETANKIKECMACQWSNIVKPGRKVKVKFVSKLKDAVIEMSHYIAKLASKSMYFFATAKVIVKITDTS